MRTWTLQEDNLRRNVTQSKLTQTSLCRGMGILRPNTSELGILRRSHYHVEQ